MWIGHRERPNEILIRNPALMGPAGRAAAALPGGHVEGFGDTFSAHFRAVYADVAAGDPSAAPGYPTFADGHDEMLVGDAIAESARSGAGSMSARTGHRRRPRSAGGAHPMRARAADRAVPRDTARWTSSTGRRRTGSRASRSPAGRGPPGPTRRYAGTSPHRRRQPVRRARRRRSWRDRRQGPDHLGSRLLPQSPAPRSGASRGGHRPPEAGHHGRREDGRPARQHVHGRATARKDQDDNWEEALRVWPDIVSFAARPRRARSPSRTARCCSATTSGRAATTSPTTPRMWRRILEQWGGTIGLNFDPSHLILQMIDIPRFIREFGPHILHVQAKDLMIDRDGLYERGIFSMGIGWQVPRLPGLGEVEWGRLFARAVACRLRRRRDHRARGPGLREDRRPRQARLPARPRRPPAVHQVSDR